jgi:glyoxylase-like metal-dependent hydrolase (beta-lactamase superfamily II)
MLLCLVSVLTFAAPQAWHLAHDVTVTALDSATYLVVHEQPYPANAVVALMPDSSAVVVNTLYTPEAARALLGWLKDTLGVTKIVAVNTHFHVDCLGGNAAFREAGIPLWGCDLTPPLLVERGERSRAQTVEWLLTVDSAQAAMIQAVPFLPPDHLFIADSGKVLAFGGERVELFYPGPAHAPDNIVVWFPARRLLFGGCMVLAGERIGNTADADIEFWQTAAERLRRFDARRVIPGHGSPLREDLIGHTVKLLAE